MDNSCPHCNAKLFKGEINTSTCCQHGLTMLKPYSQPLPNIDVLFGNAEFQKMIRIQQRTGLYINSRQLRS